LDNFEDAFGRAFKDFQRGGEPFHVIERDDGYVDVIDVGEYFTDYGKWPAPEREAIRFAQGRVLDIGCGPGRHAIYLQRKGHDVTGIDLSPLAIEVANERGLRKARVMSLSKIEFPSDSFDTVLMLGNNFALFGTAETAKRLLRKMHRLTSPHARILAGALDPYQTSNSAHLRYHAMNRERGRMSGQVRVRVRYGLCRSKWIQLLLVSGGEMKGILEGTGWRIARILESGGPNYVAVLEKESSGA
jgi:SAM-dependent methyltransferase